MRAGFYPKLAVDGFRKNRRLYVPYLLTCTGMVTMTYIVSFLAHSSAVAAMPGGKMVGSIMTMGQGVLLLFSALFLCYTNSFLMRRRRKEFGLYNILGMGKWSIAKILFWESVIIALIALIAGHALGVGLSKAFELGLVNMMGGKVQFDFSVSVTSLMWDCTYFSILFALLLLNNLRKIVVSDPVALLRSESAGEKPPRGNLLLAIMGLALLGVAYYIAVTIESPITAMVLFFVAVCMVILATYLLFIAGSVKLCRLLQKNKGYYYQESHFVSVSTMAFRMNRNGAGLASICILLTMVLVMLSSTTALFVGSEDSIRLRYPRSVLMTTRFWNEQDMSQEQIEDIRTTYRNFCEEKGVKTENVMDYREMTLEVALEGNLVKKDPNDFTGELLGTSNAVNAFLIPLEDYNRMTGEEETLEPDEVLLYGYRLTYSQPDIRIDGGGTYRIKRLLDKSWDNGSGAMNVASSIFLVTSDFSKMAESLGELGRPIRRWCWGFDTNLPAEEEIEFCRELSGVSLASDKKDMIQWFYVESREANREEFYGTYGGLFFLGMVLSLVFLSAMVLIVYYKQISEGYEDQNRFEIMRKVGMTKEDTRRAINSQMLTVFFAPLMAAGVHLCFAFPMVQKILLLFNLWNEPLLIATTAGCFLVFGLFYTMVYRVTSNSYYKIVSG